MSAPETIGVVEAAALPKHAIKVLLVDDQAIIGEAIRRMLAQKRTSSFSSVTIRRQRCTWPTSLRPR